LLTWFWICTSGVHLVGPPIDKLVGHLIREWERRTEEDW
jgi:hypothetical protein